MLENISITNDLIILGIFALSILMHVFLLNQQRFYALLFSSYVSYLGLILFLFIIFNRASIFLNYHTNFIVKTFKSIFFGILNVGVILTLLALLLPVEFLYKYSDLSLNIFNSEIGRFVCLSAPLIIFLFSIRFKRKRAGRPRMD